MVTEVASKGGLILFVGTRDGQQRIIVKAAELAGGYHLFEKWVPGSITNGAQILGRAGMKVVDEFDNEVTGFEEQLRDRAPLRPDLVVVLNPLENRVLLDECSTNQIPSIGIIDTDANPTWVTYPIPANDDRYVSFSPMCLYNSLILQIAYGARSSLVVSWAEQVKKDVKSDLRLQSVTSGHGNLQKGFNYLVRRM